MGVKTLNPIKFSLAVFKTLQTIIYLEQQQQKNNKHSLFFVIKEIAHNMLNLTVPRHFPSSYRCSE